MNYYVEAERFTYQKSNQFLHDFSIFKTQDM